MPRDTEAEEERQIWLEDRAGRAGRWSDGIYT